MLWIFLAVTLLTVYIHYILQHMLPGREKRLHWLNAGAVCLNFNLRRTTRAVTQYYDEALKPTGLKVTQFTILIAIAVESVAQGGTITSIAKLAMVDRTTLTRSLKILQQEKLIEIRKAQPGNKRRVLITDKGISKMEESYPYWFRAQRALVKTLTPVKVRTLRHLLTDAKTAAEALHDF